MATYQQQDTGGIQVAVPPSNLQPSTENTTERIGESTALILRPPEIPTAVQSRWRCCVQSKGTILILVWNICVTFGLEYFSSLLSGITTGNIIARIIVDAILAIFLLFYPLAGYLADARWGRYKTINGSVRFILTTLLIFYFLGILATCMGLAISLTVGYDGTLDTIKIVSIIVLCLSFGLPILFGILLIILSLIAFSANVIQYGIDQLEYNDRGRNFVQYVYWYVWTYYMGQFIIKIVITFSGVYSYLINASIFAIVLPIVIGITFCIKRNWDLVDTPPVARTENPYKLINRIINFALSHNNLIRLHSSDRNEAPPRSRLDLAKERYGGPFTTNQVEEVKSFLRIFCILFTLGPMLMADIAVSELLPRLVLHMDNTYSTFFNYYYLYDPLKSLISSGALTPSIVVVVLPLYMYILRPCLYNYIPGALKRIGLGMVFIFLSALCTLVMDMSGHIQSQHGNATLPVKTCFLTTGYYYYDPEYGNWYPTLHISSYVLTIQCILNAIGYMFFYISTFEFICAQSPRSVKGVLICSFFAIKGAFRLLGNLVLYAPFLAWHFSYTFPSCGFIYYLINALLVLAGLVVFVLAAKKYQCQTPPDYNEQHPINTERHALRSSSVHQNNYYTGF
jgi:peptide/histidine transporter 3/4